MERIADGNCKRCQDQKQEPEKHLCTTWNVHAQVYNQAKMPAAALNDSRWIVLSASMPSRGGIATRQQARCLYGAHCAVYTVFELVTNLFPIVYSSHHSHAELERQSSIAALPWL